MLYDWRTVAAERRAAARAPRLGPREAEGARQRDARARRADGFESSRPWQLSGGMQQRVSIARALSFDPALLLMDEPFGALDEMTRERLNMELLRIWEKSARTVVFVTHSIPEAVFLSTGSSSCPRGRAGSPRSIEVDLPQPRGGETREDPRFFELVTAVREALAAGTARRAGGRSPRRRSSTEQHRRRAHPVRPHAGDRHAAARLDPGDRRLPRRHRPLAGADDAVRRPDVPAAEAVRHRAGVLDDKGTLWDYGLYTFKEAAGGFVLGSGLGILTALILARFRRPASRSCPSPSPPTRCRSSPSRRSRTTGSGS